jgi:hypothetical protein
MKPVPLSDFSSVRCISMLSSHPCLDISSSYFMFSGQNFACISQLSHKSYTPHESHPICDDYNNYIQLRVQTIKILIIYFLTSCHLLHLQLEHSPQTLFSNILNLTVQYFMHPVHEILKAITSTWKTAWNVETDAHSTHRWELTSCDWGTMQRFWNQIPWILKSDDSCKKLWRI